MASSARDSPPRDFGVYVHIPFCRHQCAYCSFYTLPSPARHEPQRRFLAAVGREWQLRVEPRLRRGDTLRTLYLGGGTPSEAPLDALADLLASFAHGWGRPLSDLDEFTVECNPENVDAALLDRLQECGVGRVSLGVQALDDDDLARLDRRARTLHNRRALHAVAARFGSWNADLIVGFPGSSADRLRAALEELADAGAPHLSLYCFEPPRARAAQLGDALDEASDAHKADLYESASHWIESHGYEHYEISNAARPGHRAVHNEAYWTGREYVGLGPGAHSLEGGARRVNRSGLEAYLSALEGGHEPPAGREHLTAQMLRHERLLLGLRRRTGIEWRAEGLSAHTDLLERLGAAGLARLDRTRLRLTPRGWLVSDSIVLQLVTVLEGTTTRVDKPPAPWLHWV